MRIYNPLLGIFAYNRPSHFKRLLISLENYNINEIILFIDGPKNDKDKINQFYISNMAKNSKLNIKIIKRRNNLGLRNSILKGVDYLANNSEYFTILEDDLVVYENFFLFHSENLLHHKYDHEIFGICGFQFKNIEKNQSELSSFKIKYFIPWGWSSWSNKWKKFRKYNFDKIVIPEYINTKNKLKKENYWSLDVINYSKKNNQLFIYPTVSLLKNIGFDGSGVNSKVSKSFIMSEKKINKQNKKNLIKIDKEIDKKFYINLRKYADLFY